MLPCISRWDHVRFCMTHSLRPCCLAADSKSVQQHRHQLTQQISEQSQAMVPGGLTRDTLCALEVSQLFLGGLQIHTSLGPAVVDHHCRMPSERRRCARRQY